MATRANRFSVPSVMLIALSYVWVLPASAREYPPAPPPPPEEAVSACSGIAESDPCSFITPHGREIAGSCRVLMNDVSACVPTNHLRGERPGPARRDGDES